MSLVAGAATLDRAAFVALLGGVFERSPWVADAAYQQHPFRDLESLHGAMVDAVHRAGLERQLQLLNAHPDLAGKAARAGALTAASTSEQRGAGLDNLSDDEYERFQAANDAYKKKFGFPFIIAVKGHDKHSILSAYDRRLHLTTEDERVQALAEVAKIALYRLQLLERQGPGQ